MSNFPSSPSFFSRHVWDATDAAAAASFNSVNELLSGTYSSSYSPAASSPHSLVVGGTAAAATSLREALGRDGPQQKHLPDSMPNPERRSGGGSIFSALASPSSPASYGTATGVISKEEDNEKGITESFLTRGGGSFRKNGSIVLVGRRGWAEGRAHHASTTASSTISSTTYAHLATLTTDEAGEHKVEIEPKAHLGNEEGPITHQPKGDVSNNNTNRMLPFAAPSQPTHPRMDPAAAAETSVLGEVNCSIIGSDDGGPNARSTRPPSHHAADPSTLVLQLDHGSSWAEEDEASDRCLEEGGVSSQKRTQSDRPKPKGATGAGPTLASSSSKDFEHFFSESVCVEEDAQQLERRIRRGGRLLLTSEKDGVRSVDPPGTVPRSAFRSTASLPSDVCSTRQNDEPNTAAPHWGLISEEIKGGYKMKDNKKDNHTTNQEEDHFTTDWAEKLAKGDTFKRRETIEKMAEREREREGKPKENSSKGPASDSENIRVLSHHAHSSPRHPLSLRLLDAHMRYIERLAEGAADLVGGSSSCGGGAEGQRRAKCIALATQFIAQTSESSTTTQTTEISIFVGALSPSENRWLNHMNADKNEKRESGRAHRLVGADDDDDDYGCNYSGTPRSGTGGTRSWAWGNGDMNSYPNKGLLEETDDTFSSSSSESFEGKDANGNGDDYCIDTGSAVAPIRFPSFFAGHLQYTARALHCLVMCLIGQGEIASAGEALRLLWLAIEGKELIGGRDNNAAEHKELSSEGYYSHHISPPSAAFPPQQLPFSYRQHIDSNKVLQEYTSQAKAAGVPLYSSSSGGSAGSAKSKAKSGIPAAATLNYNTSSTSSTAISHSHPQTVSSVKMNPQILISSIEAVSSSKNNFNHNDNYSGYGIVAGRLQGFTGNDEFPPMVRVGTYARARSGNNTNTRSREGGHCRPSQPLLARTHALMPLHRTEYFSRNGSFFTLDNSVLTSWRAKYEQAVGGWHLERGEAAEAVLRFGNALRLLMTMTRAANNTNNNNKRGWSGEGKNGGDFDVSVGDGTAHHWVGGRKGQKDWGGVPRKKELPPPRRTTCTSAGIIESTVLSLRLKIADLLLQLGHEVSSDRVLRDIECSLNEREAMEGTAAVAVSLGRVRRLRAAAEMKRGKISSAQLLLREIIGKMEEVLFVFTSAERELDEATELEALQRELLLSGNTNSNKGAIEDYDVRRGGSGSGTTVNTNERYESRMGEDAVEEHEHGDDDNLLREPITSTTTANGLTRADLKIFFEDVKQSSFLLELGQCHLMCSLLESCDDEGSGDGGGGFGLSSMGVAFERFHRGYTLLNIALSSSAASLASGRAGLISSSPPAADVLHPLIVRAQIQLAHMFIKRGVRDSVVLPLINQNDASSPFSSSSSSSSSHIAYSVRSGRSARRGDFGHYGSGGVVGGDSEGPDLWLSAVQRALLGLGYTPSSTSLRQGLGIGKGAVEADFSSYSSVVKLILLPQSTRKQERRRSGVTGTDANAILNEEAGGEAIHKTTFLGQEEGEDRQWQRESNPSLPSFSNNQKRREVIHDEGSAVPYLPFEDCLSRSHTVLQGLLSAVNDASRRGAKVDHLRLEVLEACAEVSSNSGDFVSAVGFYTQAIDLAARLGDIRGGGVAEGSKANNGTTNTSTHGGLEAHSKDDFNERSQAVTNPWDAHINACVFSLSVKRLIASIALIEAAEISSWSASSLGDGDDGKDRGDGQVYVNSFDWNGLSRSSFSLSARRTEQLLPNAQACEAEARRLLKVAATVSSSSSSSFSTFRSPTSKDGGSGGGNKTLELPSLPEIVLWQCLASVYRLEGRWGEALDAYQKGITLCEDIESRQRNVLSSRGHDTMGGGYGGNNNCGNDDGNSFFEGDSFHSSGIGPSSGGGGGANSNVGDVCPTSLADLDVVCASAVASLREILLRKAQLLDGASLTCRNEGVLLYREDTTLFHQGPPAAANTTTSFHSSFSSTICCDSNTMFATALRYSTAALIARSQALGRRSMLVAASHANVASIYHLLGRYRDAVTSCEQCVSAVTRSLSDRLIHLPPVIPTNLFYKLSTMAGGLFAVDLPVSEGGGGSKEEKFVPYRRSLGTGNHSSNSDGSYRAAASTVVALRMPRERVQEELLNYLILKHPFYRLSSRIKSECVLKMKRSSKR